MLGLFGPLVEPEHEPEPGLPEAQGLFGLPLGHHIAADDLVLFHLAIRCVERPDRVEDLMHPPVKARGGQFVPTDRVFRGEGREERWEAGRVRSPHHVVDVLANRLARSTERLEMRAKGLVRECDRPVRGEPEDQFHLVVHDGTVPLLAPPQPLLGFPGVDRPQDPMLQFGVLDRWVAPLLEVEVRTVVDRGDRDLLAPPPGEEDERNLAEAAAHFL